MAPLKWTRGAAHRAPTGRHRVQRLVGLVDPDYNGYVNSRVQHILRDALTLPLQERADMAAELLASLDDGDVEDPAQVEAAWATETERRTRRAPRGTMCVATARLSCASDDSARPL